MRKIILSLMIFLFGVGTSFAEEHVIALEKAPINIHDTASIKRGAKFFSTTCMVCHTLIYLRHDKLAQEAGVLYSRMPVNVKTWPFDVTPPDLSLEANARGVDWIYTYLHSFYSDPSRPTGFNNLLFPNAVMPGILAPYQGQLVRIADEKLIYKIYDHQLQWYDILELKAQGTMTPEQFDGLVTDIVNFLAYAAEPYKAEQMSLGWWVIGFLLIFFVLTYLLKKAYWKNIPHDSSSQSTTKN